LRWGAKGLTGEGGKTDKHVPGVSNLRIPHARRMQSSEDDKGTPANREKREKRKREKRKEEAIKKKLPGLRRVGGVVSSGEEKGGNREIIQVRKKGITSHDEVLPGGC